ncbi:MAG: hypothetical protein ACTHM5_02355 [Ginsengibacter sp.]
MHQDKRKSKSTAGQPADKPPITGKATAGQTAGNTTRIKKEAASYS